MFIFCYNSATSNYWYQCLFVFSKIFPSSDENNDGIIVDSDKTENNSNVIETEDNEIKVDIGEIEVDRFFIGYYL